jgi:serine/threonine protein kinase
MRVPPNVDAEKLHQVGPHLLLLNIRQWNSVRKIFQSSPNLKILRQTQYRDIKKIKKLTDIEHELSLPYNIYRDEENKLYAMYQREELLGKGGSARVKLAQDLQTGEWVAVKIYKIPLKIEHIKKAKIEQEIQFEKVVDLYLGRSIFKRKLDIKYYVFKKYIFGELLSAIIKNQRIKGFLEKVNLAVQLVEAVIDCHKKGFLHADIKPKNIIIDQSAGVVKLIDFGISVKSQYKKQLIAHTSKVKGTKKYMAPEYEKGQMIFGKLTYAMTDKTESYAAGVTLGRLFNSTPMSETHKMMIGELITGLCESDPTKRLSLYEAGIRLKKMKLL